MIIEYVNTIGQLLEFIKNIKETNKHHLWFRGVADESWPLLPSIQRSKDRIICEKYIINDFYIKARQVLENSPPKKNYAAWISLMQHFGLPTRMLDWSSSPLIASFFAVEKYEEHPETDAAIWVLTPGLLNRKEGFGTCIYPVDADTAQKMLRPAFKKQRHTTSVDDKILACHSTENNLRMYSQQANFTIHNSLKRLEDICDDDTLYKIIIPKDSRRSFLTNLEIFGITESFVYPDLEHISNDLKRQYNI